MSGMSHLIMLETIHVRNEGYSIHNKENIAQVTMPTICLIFKWLVFLMLFNSLSYQSYTCLN